MLGLKPIKLLPARERVASALRKAIISKSIPEGAELTLENTAQELGVSVTPVREAFQILARDGLLPAARCLGRDGMYALLPEQCRPVQDQKLRGYCRGGSFSSAGRKLY